jgi:high affinity Mn2+ porin
MYLAVRPGQLGALAGLVLASIIMPVAAETATATDAPPADAAAIEPVPDEAPAAVSKEETYSFHGQFTEVTQFHPAFASPFRGTNSLDPGNRGDETVDVTLFGGIRIADGLAFYIDPEIDQGFGLSNTLGVADFPSGEAFKIGTLGPKFHMQRAFARYTIDLGGEVETDEPDQNQLGGSHTANNIVITVGKFSIPDIFDNNAYAHNQRVDFLNFALIDAGAFDYAADPFGYTYGGAVEWTQDRWTLRFGLFDLSHVPNGATLAAGFGEFSTVAEAELREHLWGTPGKIRILAFENTGDLANYNDAVRAAQGTGMAPNVALVRKYSTAPGGAVNLEQELMPDLGFFLRGSVADGHKEADDFTDIDRSLSTGLSLTGARWGRKDDTVGLAGIISGISRDAQRYLAAGGLGILIGDGRLPQYEPEKVLEVYYSATIIDSVTFGVDYQRVENPAYDADRGPVDILGFRFHSEF